MKKISLVWIICMAIAKLSAQTTDMLDEKQTPELFSSEKVENDSEKTQLNNVNNSSKSSLSAQKIDEILQTDKKDIVQSVSNNASESLQEVDGSKTLLLSDLIPEKSALTKDQTSIIPEKSSEEQKKENNEKQTNFEQSSQQKIFDKIPKETKPIGDSTKEISKKPKSAFEKIMDEFQSMFGSDGFRVFKNPFAFDLSTHKKGPSEEQTEVKLEEHYKVRKQIMTFTLPEDLMENEMYFVQVFGTGRIHLEFFNDSSKITHIIEKKIIYFDASLRPAFIPIDREYLGKKDQLLILSNDAEGHFSDWSFVLKKQDKIVIAFEVGVKLYSRLMKTINILVRKSLNGESVKTSELDKRTQFILESSLGIQTFKGLEKLKMFVNFANKSFPTENKFDFEASGSLGTGLIKTLSKNKPFYCGESDCDYYITIISADVDFMVFYITELSNGATLTFKNNLILTEEIEEGENIFYKLEVPQMDSDLIFSYFPIAGRASLFVNPDEKPNDLSQYRYQVSSGRPEQIRITNFEANVFKFTKKVFFVSFDRSSNQEAVVFKLEVRKLSPKEKFFIQENFTESGVLAVGEIINYYVDFVNPTDEVEEELSVNLQIDTFFGDSDIYVKECENINSDCAISEDDIKNSLINPKNSTYIFKHLKNEEFKSTFTNTQNGNVAIRRGKLGFKFNCLPFFSNYLMSPVQNGLPKSNLERLSTNNLKSSKTCKFAIGIYCRSSTDALGSRFKLNLAGNGVHQEMFIEIPQSFQMASKDVQFYKIRLTPFILKEFESLKVKIITLEGDYSLFFSFTNKYPNAEDAVLKMAITDENAVSLNTMSNSTIIDLTKLVLEKTDQIKKNEQISKKPQFFMNLKGKIEKLKNPETEAQINSQNPFFRKQKYENKHLYMSVESKKKSFFEIYMSPVFKSSSMGLIPDEIIIPSKLIHRSIELISKAFDQKNGERIFHSDFLFKHQIISSQNKKISELKITLNSDSSGLKICVQTDSESFYAEKGCQFESEIGVLSIKSSDYDFISKQRLVISIQAPNSKKNGNSSLPIDFSLVVNLLGNGLAIQLPNNGKTFTSAINRHGAMIFRIKLDSSEKNALILFDCEDLKTKAEFGVIKNNLFSFVEEFDQFTFGVQIKDTEKFCEKYVQNKRCEVEIYVYSNSRRKSKFSITHSLNNKPIGLKEGDFISFPSDIDQYFIYEMKSKKALSFSLFSPETKGVLFSSLLTTTNNFKKELNEMNYSYKSGIDNHIQITYSANDLKKSELNFVGYLYKPKFTSSKALENESKMFNPLKSHQKARIVINSHVMSLLPFYDLPGYCLKGEFKYYRIYNHSGKNLTVILSMIAGNAEVYFSHGKNNFPTQKRYLLKEQCRAGKEVEFTTHNPAFLKKSIEILTLGVFCVENSKYSLIYLPAFDGFIRLQFQKLISIKMKKGEDYFFDYFNNQGNYHTLLYSLESDVEVSALNFKISKAKNFIEMISEDKNWAQEFVFKKGSPPRKHFSEHSHTKNNHIVIKMTALTCDSDVSFAIYDDLKPINIPSSKTIQFTIDANDSAIFQVQLNAEFEESLLSVTLLEGKIDLWLSDSLENLDDKIQSTHLMMMNLEQIETVFKHKKREKGITDIYLFSEVFIKIKSKNLSHFTLNVRPKNQMKMIHANIPELIHSNPSTETYVYFELQPSDIESIKNLQIQITSVASFDEKLVFKFDPNFDLTLEGAEFLPMNIKDILESRDNHYLHMTVFPTIENGSYIVIIPKHSSRIPYKITVLLNDEKIMMPNSISKNYYENSLESSSHNFSVYLPKKGEFRILAYTCQSINIQNVVFYEKDGSSEGAKITLEDHFVQGFPYLNIQLDENMQSTRELSEFVYPLKRFMAKSAGLLKFDVRIPEFSQKVMVKKFEDYVIMNEFIPDEKELMLKDFVTIVSSSNELEKYMTNYEYVNYGQDLRVSTKFPSFKPQLIQDYPHLRKIEISMYFSLIGSKNVKSMLDTCGFSFLQKTQNVLKTVTKMINIKEIDLGSMPSYITVMFTSDEINSIYSVNSERSIFGHAKIRFIENEEEEFELILDEKVTYVPYFLIELRKQPFVLFSSNNLFFFGMSIVLVIGAFLILKKLIFREKTQISKSEYENPIERVNSRSTKLEMSAISKNKE